ncbi:FxDxF family PEP-CTERM protein [Ferribacterium limneticum]|uniref:FxDxF family PEP-CTERM protein n=1 Tax=Ferribacterium limneticum TaxID=76259 RepID=UPI001CF9A58B|nr:FxDxF family PEP-CTERM protein [Ferribacterium limneticum]UCV17961.1 PEP-CTERM sorting domain-containing protein [Ferribacterium limneticum]
MKFSLKTIAAAVVMAAAAASANAAIDNGALGNGELMFNAWDGQTSYVYDMNVSIDSFESALNAGGALNLSWGNDFTTSFGAWVGTAATSSLKWSILAVESDGQRRILSTVGNGVTLPALNGQADALRTAVTTVQTSYLNNLNPLLGDDGTSYVTTSTASAGYAGKIGDKVYSKFNFSTVGNVGNDSYANGLVFEQTLANASGIAKGTNTAFVDGTAVHAWVAADNTLHIAAATLPVPEPESYAMLLAGLGMIGFMARRRKSA